MKPSTTSLIVVVIALCGVACAKKELTESQKRQEFLSTITKECSQEVKIDIDSGMKLLLGDLTINNDKAKCFVRCVFKKDGFINENDEPQFENIILSVPNDAKHRRKAMAKMLKKCENYKNDDPCESAYKLLECYLMGQNLFKKIEL